MSDLPTSSPAPLRQVRRNAATRGAQSDGAAVGPGSRQMSPVQGELAQLVVDELRSNCRLNFRVRCGLALFGFTAGGLALLVAVLRAGGIADAAGGGGDIFLACFPIVVLVALSVMCGVAAWTVHARGLDEVQSTLDAVNRMEREGEVAVSSRGLIYAFEEKLQNTRRAFTLLLWLGRTLFIVCLALCCAAIISALKDAEPLLTGSLGAGSVVGALFGAATKVPRNISHHLADVIQIQTAVTGCDRQISLLETAAIDIVNRADDRASAHDDVLAVQRRMDQVVAHAVYRIERYADPEFRSELQPADG